MSFKLIRGSLPTNLDKYNAFKKTVPVVLANKVQDHFLDGFKKGGGQTNKSRGGWRKRKPNSKRNAGRALLVDTGTLRGDIKKRVITFRKIVVGTQNIKYAPYINEGTPKMPQREFIGASRELEKEIIKILENGLKPLLSDKPPGPGMKHNLMSRI